MSIAYDLDRANRIVHVLITDSISIADVEASFVAIKADLRGVTHVSAVIDARELRRAFFVREGANLARALASKPAHFIRRYAFIIGQDFAPRAGRRFLVQARRAGINLKLFRDHATALEWLQAPPQSGV